MKNLLYVGIFLVSGALFAQEKPRSMSETTEVKTVKVNNGKEVVENKVKVTTREEKEIRLDEDDAGHVNQDMVLNNDKTIIKTIEIDNDSDPFYDSKIELVTYVNDGEEYSFVRNTNGFTVSMNDSNKKYGNAVRSTLDGRYYIFNNVEFSGIGYFDDEGSFVVEYYNNDENSLITKKYLTVNADK
jgi:ribosomal protein S4E